MDTDTHGGHMPKSNGIHDYFIMCLMWTNDRIMKSNDWLNAPIAMATGNGNVEYLIYHYIMTLVEY